MGWEQTPAEMLANKVKSAQTCVLFDFRDNRFYEVYRMADQVASTQLTPYGG